MVRLLVLTLSLLILPATLHADPPPEGPAVIVAEAVSRPLADRVEALGTLKANEAVTITANVTEVISAIHFDDGERVTRGQVLVEMNSAEQQALLDEAIARLGEAERQFERVKSLVAQRSASESMLDERRRDVETTRALVVAIRARLADRVIEAPFDGVVGLRDISLGALVTPGDLITTIDDDSVMKLDFAVPSVYLTTLAPGMAIEARARAFGDEVFTGAIRGIDSRVDPVTRSIQVRAILPNPERRLRPGVLMRVELKRNEREAPVIPEAALVQAGREHFVFALSAEHVVERRRVEIGARLPGVVEIRDGVAVGERVISQGQDKVRPGQTVRVLAVDDGTRTLREMLEAGQ
ncbi:efflux RND transporter periplasmic adaptor subunit [Thiococcus pfennigii]|jgi:membrane fusion protein (multidrug efflux system)|uniref:efflux RND transporter periplasmic adaptor subunit n=1 Tax=Thiococcus pfennigii TaxID=1057 RepID=UPI0019043C5B|nr:efflux RND transporter periplasmic adaptor subunit [Thiococcus pfennigii]MBK1699463.1 efflux transporter periplasmic adaptor subunit [Thiococcus pfennigii]MBK1730256.1 efflux transporter periplasmic adaptor subunit [Thiococcus pfennigii]